MTTLYKPAIKLTINGFDVSNTIKPYLISINIEEVFNTSFEPTRLEIVFHSKYLRSSSWKYKDLIRVELWWEPFPTFKYISPAFYVDYIDDLKAGGGNQTFRVSALSADPSLGFSFGANEISYTNTTILTAVTNFASLFGLTLSQNLASNVYLGVAKNISDTVNPPDVDVISIDFESYADMLRYICETYGYYGDLRGTTLRLFKINSTFTDTARFFTWSLPEITDQQFKQTYSTLYKQYQLFYIDRDDADAYAIGSVTPTMSAQLNNKIQNLEFTDAYYNVESAIERGYGKMYQDFLSGFEMRLTMSALPEFTAGNVFLLDSTYGANEGYYRCTRVVHRVDAGGWNADLTGFPIDVLNRVTATFNTAYVGRNIIPDSDLIITQNIAGTTAVTGTRLDAFAKFLNPDYTFNLGATFVTEGNKSGNQIRADIAFCIALVMTTNFTDTTLTSIFNPGGLATGGGALYASFPNWNTGIRAMIQHLFAYSKATGTPADTIVDPRFNLVDRGVAPTIDDLAVRWTIMLDFTSRVKGRLQTLHERLNPTKNVIIS